MAFEIGELMTLAEMVERYGEAEVVRWCETGRKNAVRDVPMDTSVVPLVIEIDGRYLPVRIEGVEPTAADRRRGYVSLLAALEATDA